jgi:diadenosine tetraphosphatase ApaH/serine/threonine PP2A family protein phosphatase
MRYLVLTDIHANVEALDTCVAHARERGYDGTLVLGDIVGYGPDPNIVVERVQALAPAGIVRGNHDKVAWGIDQAEGFNMVAKSAAIWTFEALTPEHRDWLGALPQGPRQVDNLIEICHGSPVDEDLYIFDELDALRALRASKRPLCLFGHTHQPLTFEQPGDGGEAIVIAERSSVSVIEIALHDGCKYLMNPGAVGQPRDGDPRAAYAIVDTDRRRVELVRVEYAVPAVQAKIIKAGLPEVLAQRLAVGR